MLKIHKNVCFKKAIFVQDEYLNTFLNKWVQQTPACSSTQIFLDAKKQKKTNWLFAHTAGTEKKTWTPTFLTWFLFKLVSQATSSSLH